MDKTLRSALILLLITALAGLLVGLAHQLTSEPIRLAREREKTEALRRALPAADTFRPFETGTPLPGVLSVEEGVADERTVGLCVLLDSSGYAGPIRLLVGIDTDGAITGLEILSLSETPGLGSNAAEESFRERFKGASAPLAVTRNTPGAGEIEALSGATITTKAVVDGVNLALELFSNDLSRAIGREKDGARAVPAGGETE